MRAGRLDRHITIQRKTVSYDAAGEPFESWTGLATNWAASISPVRGAERLIGEQIVATEQNEFRFRWATAIATLSSLDRIVYPASDASSSPPPIRSIYNIIDVQEIGRREGFTVITSRQADVT